MPPVVKQSLSVVFLTAIITPIVVAMILGIGSLAFSKSEDVTKVVAAVESFQKNFESVAKNTDSLRLSVSEISTQMVNNHLEALISIKNIETKNEVFQSKMNTKIDVVEEKIADVKGQQKYILGRINPKRIVEQ